MEDISLTLAFPHPRTDHPNPSPLSISANRAAKSHFYSGTIIYTAVAILELLSELLYIRAQNRPRLNIRVRVEGIAIMVESIAASPVLAFAARQAECSPWLLVASLGVSERDTNYAPRQAQAMHDMCGFSLHCSALQGIVDLPRVMTVGLAGRAGT